MHHLKEAAPLEPRELGVLPACDGHHARLVDALSIHGEPLTFQALLRQVLTPRTRYLVLDLDGTTHLGRNLGELFGWEMSATVCYGDGYLERARSRKPGRLYFDWSKPLSLMRYVARGGRLWAVPGLAYLFGVKMGMRSALVRPWLYRFFGPEPVGTIQQLPRTALVHQMGDLPLHTLQYLAQCVWDRLADDQVITRADIDWVRREFPGVRVILNSASPQPVLQVAAAALGADDHFSTSIGDEGGYYQSPYQQHWWYLRWKSPRRIAPPSGFDQNAGIRKLENMLVRYPDFVDPDVETVGISDTNYGEDHSWTNYFSKVADINSQAPFSPIVSARSPLREVHSAIVLTQKEIAARAGGAAAYLDPRRKAVAARAERRFQRDELGKRLLWSLQSVEELAGRYHEAAQASQEESAALAESSRRIDENLELATARYNESGPAERLKALRALRRELAQASRLAIQRRRRVRPLAQLTCALATELAAARAALEEDDPSA